MMWAFLLSLACAVRAERSGLVSHVDKDLLIEDLDGRVTRLVVEGEGRWIHGCDGCEITVSGPRLMKKLWVRDFEIRRAGDGDQPFVGLLRRHGAQLILDDRTTGRPIILDKDSAAGLVSYEGRPVMIIGFIVGAQTVRVMAFRLLDEGPPEGSD